MSLLAASGLDAGERLGPALVALREGVSGYLPRSYKKVSILMESTAVARVFWTTLMSLPYVGAARELKLLDPCHFLSVRASFFETYLICVASAVHSFCMGLLYTGLAILTLGLSRQLNYGFEKHWTHTFYSMMGAGISLTGVLSPAVGAYCTYGSLVYFWKNLKLDYEGDRALFEDPLIREIVRIYKRYEQEIKEGIYAYVDDHRKMALIRPFFEHFSHSLPSVKTIDQLFKLAKETLENYSKVDRTPANGSRS